MKTLLFILLLLLSLQVLSQPSIGIELGTFGFTDRNKMMYLDKTISYGGNIGVKVDFPAFHKKLILETGVLLNDYYYRLRGPKYTVWFTDQYKSGFYIHENINTITSGVPFSIIYNSKKIQPFLGAEFQISLSKEPIYNEGLGSMAVGNPPSFSAEGEDLVDLSEFNWFLNGGIYWVYSSHTKFKLQYSRGMNHFTTHAITPKIVNGVNEAGTTLQTTSIDKVELSWVYFPQWKKKQTSTDATASKQNKKPFKEILKSIYQ